MIIKSSNGGGLPDLFGHVFFHFHEIKNFRGILGCKGDSLVEFISDSMIFLALALLEFHFNVLSFVIEFHHFVVPELIELVELF